MSLLVQGFHRADGVLERGGPREAQAENHHRKPSDDGEGYDNCCHV
jgi:hypothetical protein